MKTEKIEPIADEKLQELMREWVARLGLQNWKILLLTKCKPVEMTDQDTDGCVDYAESSRTARIELVDPGSYGERVIPYDEEKTLVHELMHLKMSLFFEADPWMERVAHLILNDLAEALVEAKRFNASEEEASEWIMTDDAFGLYRCPKCNHTAPEDIKWYYCPVCGTKLGGQSNG